EAEPDPDRIDLIQLDGGGQFTIGLYDADGNELRSVETDGSQDGVASLDLANLEPGDYFLRISSDGFTGRYQFEPAVDNRPESIGRVLLDLSGPGTGVLSLAGLEAGMPYYIEVSTPDRIPT
nr:T9SS type A sorting domain-containing protein [Desulfuromonadales bacterium]